VLRGITWPPSQIRNVLSVDQKRLYNEIKLSDYHYTTNRLGHDDYLIEQLLCGPIGIGQRGGVVDTAQVATMQVRPPCNGIRGH
jgi:hypothetical protein